MPQTSPRALARTSTWDCPVDRVIIKFHCSNSAEQLAFGAVSGGCGIQPIIMTGHKSTTIIGINRAANTTTAAAPFDHVVFKKPKLISPVPRIISPRSIPVQLSRTTIPSEENLSRETSIATVKEV